MIEVGIREAAGEFAEDKDIARDLREARIAPAVEAGDTVTIDFAGVGLATQSFIHAMISDIIRRYGSDVLDRLLFKSCNESVKAIISIVVDYSQDPESER